MMREKCSYSFVRSLVKGQDHCFFKNLTGVFCTVGSTLVKGVMATLLKIFFEKYFVYTIPHKPLGGFR
jgi:hypothetical protein